MSTTGIGNKSPVQPRGLKARPLAWAVTVVCLIGWLLPSVALAAEDGRIKGRLFDASTGDPLLGFSVYLENTTTGAVSDLDGNYIIKNVEPGTYNLIASGIGYEQVKIPNLVVEAGETLVLDMTLNEQMVEMDSVVVRGRILENTDATTLKIRQKADFVGDAVSSEQMSRSGAGDAAGAMEKVVGASVIGGKYVYIRGLGDRYANTQLNGSPLPSADPDRQAVQMDLIPSNQLDNIVVQKTFTPDKPGNFSGGSVNLTTKDLPDERTFTFSSSVTYNSNASFEDGVLTYEGGTKDWLGYDDGTRGIPEELENAEEKIPHRYSAIRDSAVAARLDQMTESFKPQMHPGTRTAPVDQSYSLSYGDLWQFMDKPLGVQASLTFSRKHTYFNDGQVGRYHRPNAGEGLDELTMQLLVDDEKGAEKVTWGGLVSTSYRPHTRHKFNIDYMYNRSGESIARLLSGDFPEQLPPTYNAFQKHIWRTRVLEYVERYLSTLQMAGEHDIKVITPVRTSWHWSYSATTQEEPDRRYFSDNILVDLDSAGNIVDTSEIEIKASSYPVPTRLFRDLNESIREGQVNFQFPLTPGRSRGGNVKTGLAYFNKDRDFRERAYQINEATAVTYNGDPNDYIKAENMGIMEEQYDPSDTTQSRIPIGLTMSEIASGANDYDGRQDIFAWYGMIDYPVTKRIQVIGGVRRESTEMDIDRPRDFDPNVEDTALIDDADWLPSLNIRYGLTTEMNIRLAYGRTLARPNLREMAPFASDEHVGGYKYEGNADLTYTKINNFDFRWEWYTGPGEVLAASAFYKRLKNPIELVVLNPAGDLRPQNVDRGEVYGVEFEWRQGLGRLTERLDNFQFGGNLTIVHSVVDISEDELTIIRAFDPDWKTRELQGQSPYLVNLDLTYQLPKRGFTASLLYNVFGERYMVNGLDATPDIYEQPEHQLDFTLSARIMTDVNFKFAAKNLLNEKTRWIHHYKGGEFVHHSYSTGRSFSIGMSYGL